MTTIVSNAGSVGDHGQGGFQHEPDHPAKPAQPTAAAEPAVEASDVRLIIELDPASGGFVYSTVDHRTGEVIRKLPRDGLLQLGATPDYAAGALIKARA